MILTAVQIGGPDGPFMKLGDRVRVKRTGKTGTLIGLSWNFHPRPYEGRYIVDVEFPNPCDRFDDVLLFLEDIEFDPLEQMAREL